MDIDQDITRTSFRNRNWALPETIVAAGDIRETGLPPAIARVLIGRGVTPDRIADFLDPKLKNLLPDPSFFQDMDVGVKHLSGCIRRGDMIGIFSDYDCDGATSAGVLGRFLRMLGHTRFHLRIPDRIKEGYGPNTPALLNMKTIHGCDTICILDSGSVAFEPLKAAKSAGIDVVVVDHHGTEAVNPEAEAFINPNRKDQKPGYGALCAAGMTFIFCIGVARELAREGFIDGQGGRPGKMPNLMLLLDMVALGTVCDVVSLNHPLNRAFVSQGLKVLNATPSLGIVALAAAAGLKEGAPFTEKECGWILGPRINAGGRIGDTESGARLLLETDPAEARRRAETLEMLNCERKEMDGEATKTAIAQFEDRVPGRDRDVAIAVVDAHEGIVGISAGRLKDAVDAPAIVLAPVEGDMLKGSARSVPGFDIGHAITQARQQGLIEKGGGHGMAGGLTLRRDQLDGFKAFLATEIRKTDYFRDGLRTNADASFSLKELNVDLLDGFEALRPFGAENPEPVVILRGVVPVDFRVLKGLHFKVSFRDGDRSIDGLIWNVVGTEFGRQIEDALNTRVDLLCKPQINEFRGNRSPQVIVEDVRFSDTNLI